MTNTEAWGRIAQAFQYLAAGGSETRTSRGDLFEELARVANQMASGAGGVASQLDANGTILDVNVINPGELLVRVGTTIVSTPAGAPGLHAVTHQNGGTDQISVAGLLGVLANPQPPIIGPGAAQAVAGNDPRLTDARVPLAHTHPESDVVGLVADLALRALLTDPRFTDARVPLAHTHPESEIVNLVSDLSILQSFKVPANPPNGFVPFEASPSFLVGV